MNSRRRIAVALIGAIGLQACGGAFEGKGPRPAEVRLVTGKFRPPSPAIFARQPLALELVGASLDARQTEPALAFYSGTPFSASSNGGLPVTFRLAIPARKSVVLFFQVPVDRGSGVGHLVAPIRFARNASGRLTDLIYGKIGSSPVALKDLDLGTVEITLATRPAPAPGASDAPPCRPTYQVLAGEGESNNPLKLSDADGDGVPDFFDPDSNKNGIPDELESDVDGDGIPDVAQSLDALSDTEGCGAPDRFR